jgi:hypothetical protein
LVDVQRFGDAKTQTAILIHPKLTDPQNFDSILKQYQFEEDKREIRGKLIVIYYVVIYFVLPVEKKMKQMLLDFLVNMFISFHFTVLIKK